MEIAEAETRGDHGIIFKRVGPELTVIERGFTTTVPSQALAISNKFGLTFFLHSEGFCVTYTQKLVESSQSLVDSPKKKVNAQEGCVASISMCALHSLSLSKDELMIAACTADKIHFYSVPALVQKGNCGDGALMKSIKHEFDIKCLEWNKSQNDLILVLSRERELRAGSFTSELKLLAKNVEAADWSPDGEFLCYVTTDMELHTCKSNMSQSSTFKLPEQMFCEAPGGGLEAYVDTLKWVCMDSILLTCVHKNEVDDEDDYWLFLLVSNSGHMAQIHDGYKILSFDQFFTSIDTSIIPPGTGPYLLASYIEPWSVVIATSRRSIDDHISLLGWIDEDGKLEACKLELDDDRFTPRIELQDSGDDNFVVGLVVDQTTSSICLPALNGEPGETLPAGPVLICMTIEGNLSLFSVARTDVKWSSAKVISNPVPLPAADGFPIAQGLQDQIKASGEKIQEEEAKINEVIDGKNKEQIEKELHGTVRKDGKLLGVKLGGVVDTEAKVAFPEDISYQEQLQNARVHGIQQKTIFPQPQKSFFPRPDPGREIKTERLNNIQMRQSVFHGMSDQKQHGSEKKLTAIGKDQKLVPVSPASEIESDFEKALSKVKLMAEEIDALMEFIEKKKVDRTKESKALFTKSLMEQIESETHDLSLECQKFRENLMERKQNIDDLRDASMQVDAWRVYLQSVVEQVSDMRYQEIWSNQKLHPEMDAARKRILQMDQSLKQQIADLEGHLHNLELSNWQRKKQLKAQSASIPQPPEKFRRIQSLYETVNTQMLVAQQLDHRLKQLIEALQPSKGVKEELETLMDRPLANIECLTLEEHPSKKISDAFTRTKAFGESSELTAFSPLRTSVNMSMQTPTKLDVSSGMRMGLQDSTRRRRDSVDQLWVDVGAAKTTVKRTAAVKHSERLSTPPKAIQPLHVKDLSISPQYHHGGTKDKIRNASATSTSGHREDIRRLDRGSPSLRERARPAVQSHISVPVSKTPTSYISDASTSAWQPGVTSTTISASIKETISSDALKGRRHEVPLISTISRPTAPQAISMISSPTVPQSISVISRPTTPQLVSTISTPTASQLLSTISMPTVPLASGSMQFGLKMAPEIESQAVGTVQYPLKKTSEFQVQTSSIIQSEMLQTGVKTGTDAMETFNKHQMPLHQKQQSASLNFSSQVAMSQGKESESKTGESASEFHPKTQERIREKATLDGSISLGTSVSVNGRLQEISVVQPHLLSEKKTNEEATNIPQRLISETSSREPKTTVADTDSLGVTPVPLPSVMPIIPAIVSPVHVLSSASMTSPVTTVSSPSIPLTSKTPSVPNNSSTETTQLPETAVSSITVQAPAISDEEDMEEEENSQIDFGATSFAGFGLGSIPSSSGPQLSTPFGVSTVWTQSSSAASSLSVPAGQLFKPASFSIPSSASTSQQGSSLFRPPSFSLPTSASSQQTSSNLFGSSFTTPSVGFGIASSPFSSSSQPSTPAFGQPQTASSGQQVLGSALGAFGQTRQIGTPFGVSSPSGHGGGGFAGVASTGSGFTGISSTSGGFAGIASTGGGFAAVASTGSGFAAVATSGSGFAGVASTGGGFASLASGGGGFGGGFASAATGFSGAGAFGGAGFGGFSSFGTNANSSIFTQMRK